jgi:uncharacterized membrane protein YdbT with pleckstrin-like domain
MSQRSRLKSKKISHVDTRRIEQALSSGSTLRQIIPLQTRKIVKKTFWGLCVVVIGWCLASLLLWKFWLENLPIEQTRVVWTSWALFLVVLILWRTAYQILYFITYKYSVDQSNLSITKGVLAKREITLPFSKITDVYIDQDLLDVVFGLYDLHISSPTEQSGRVAHIDGIDRRGAVQLRTLILEKINANDASSREEAPERKSTS